MPSQHGDEIDFEGCYWRMVAALEPYWFERSSMSPETAIAKLVAENEVLREALDRITWAVGWDACAIAREALSSVKG